MVIILLAFFIRTLVRALNFWKHSVCSNGKGRPRALWKTLFEHLSPPFTISNLPLKFDVPHRILAPRNDEETAPNISRPHGRYRARRWLQPQTYKHSIIALAKSLRFSLSSPLTYTQRPHPWRRSTPIPICAQRPSHMPALSPLVILNEDYLPEDVSSTFYIFKPHGQDCLSRSWYAGEVRRAPVSPLPGTGPQDEPT